MSNPLVDAWLATWDKLTGRTYRYRLNPAMINLDFETQNLIHVLWQYQEFEYEQAQDLLNSGSLYPQFQYRHFKKRKPDGNFRELVEPEPLLKSLQKRLLKTYLESAPVHQAAMGYRPKLSIANHVWAHVGAKFIITADIEDFFPNTSHFRIHEWWYSQFNSTQAADLATILTTYRGGLPQGASTSPALSNIVNHDLDTWLSRKAERNGAVYTRYVDDMVFSWHGNDRPPADMRQSIASSLHEFGYELKNEKWQIYRAEDEPEITGVILRKHGTVSIPDSMRQKIRELERNEPQSQRLAGYRGFQKMIERKS
jgi:RNA-directed DNA polymerase